MGPAPRPSPSCPVGCEWLTAAPFSRKLTFVGLWGRGGEGRGGVFLDWEFVVPTPQGTGGRPQLMTGTKDDTPAPSPHPPACLEVGLALWYNSCQDWSSAETAASLLPFPVLACFPRSMSPEIPSSGTAAHSHPCLGLRCEGTWPSKAVALCCMQVISAPAKGASMFNVTPKSP